MIFYFLVKQIEVQVYFMIVSWSFLQQLIMQDLQNFSLFILALLFNML